MFDVTSDNQIYPLEFSKLDRQDNQKDDLYDLAKLNFSSEKTDLVVGFAEEDIKPVEKVLAGGYIQGNWHDCANLGKLYVKKLRLTSTL